MAQGLSPVFKIPTKSPQAARGAGFRHASGQVRSRGAGRPAARGGGEVIELEHGITVYPARSDGGRWRAVWHEAGKREQCEAATEAKLAAKLVTVTVTARLAADAPLMRRRCTGRPGDRPLPAPDVSVAGESALGVDPGEIPPDDDIVKLGQALAAGRHGERDELMAGTAAYSACAGAS